MASFEHRGSTVRAVVRLPGGAKKTATFDTESEAKAWAARMEFKKDIGQLRPGKAGSATNGDLFELYLDAVASKTDSAKWNKLRLMKWLNDPLADKKVSATTTPISMSGSSAVYRSRMNARASHSLPPP